MRTGLLTALAMLAFAANSLLCRQALSRDAIDPASFGTLRVISGAVTLAAIVLFRSDRTPPRPNGRTAGMLFAYVACFSFAYVTLDAGVGALILFGAVQLTMIIASLVGGERFGVVAWIGLALAVAGLVYLLSPGFSAPPLVGAMLMAAAGVAWGGYSLLGRSSTDALGDTMWNFVLAVPLVLLVSLVFRGGVHLTRDGALLAVASGSLASGLGYVVWFAALKGLKAGTAATVQLSVPVIAAIGGVALLGEPASSRLVLASVAVLGGIGLVLSQKYSPAASS